MDRTRKTSVTTGVLLVVATAAALAAAQVVPGLTGTGEVAALADHPHRLAAAATLYLVAAGTSAGIAVALYPVLRGAGPAAALGAVVFRTVEAVLYTVAVVALMALLPLARRVATAPEATSAALSGLADVLVDVRDLATLAGVFAFGTGALLYYALLHRARLLPRWLSGWGLAGAALILVACLLSLFSGRPVTGYTLLVLPVAAQEMVLAVRLLVTGFDRPAEVAAGATPAARG
ncbi:DUF4386 domain-containing protein [Kineosporia sp. A_224]|uniref:DUF4386 domain-containing protein n=1 Tax=Kineosporia sp. A_224 TaxID=1962180 RepID=UPI0013045626|nr:DUF4386 domain-containing protein [Kineosporia sp. A_224]